MGLINFLLGGGLRHVGRTVAQVGGVFAPNAEAQSARDHDLIKTATEAYQAEFGGKGSRGGFTGIVDGLNRLVRPVITLSVFSVLPLTVLYPEKMAISFAAIALLPTGYWALIGSILPFYFAGRMQIKAQEFQAGINAAVARAPVVIENMRQMREDLRADAASKDAVEDPVGAIDLPPSGNAAVDGWRKSR